MTIRVDELWTYPIKSCRGVRLEQGTLEPRGLPLDRRFMVVDAEGRFRTQRRDPRLARVAVELEPGRMTIRANDVGEVSVDVERAGSGPLRGVNVWRHRGDYPEQGADAAGFFTELLGAPSQLVFMPESATRRPNPKFGGQRDDRVGFADAYPFLLTSHGSLESLAARMEEEVPMDRFRANVVIAGARAWAEDEWRGDIRIGAARFTVAKPCARCVITTTDQQTGTRHREPLPTLTRHRKVGRGVNFGVYLLPRSIGAVVTVGDILRVEAPS